MEKMRLWARFRYMLLMLSLCIGITAALPAGAQTLPSSSTPATGLWTKMHPSSFSGTIKSAYDQCQRDADINVTDLLTPKKCQDFRDYLEHGLCEVVMVPDGIVHDFMNGRTNSKSKVTFNIKKQTGRYDRAFMCNLGDGVYAYWYTGIRNQSCNNVAFSFEIPPPSLPPVEVVTPPVPKGKWVCREVQFKDTVRSGAYQHLDGFRLEGCCCGNDTFVPSHSFYIGDDLKSSGHTEVCDWVQF